MRTRRKVGCCLFAAVCGVTAASVAVADGLSVKVEVEDFVTCDPVVTATFPAAMQRVAVEWAKAEDGEFVELGAVENPEGTTFAYTNAVALIADRRWYRVTATDADGSASSAAVSFARFRQLERRSTGKSKGLVDGCVQFKAYWPFDGTIDNHDNACPIGINFKRQVHIAGFRLLSKMARENNKPIYGAKNYATYSSDNVVLATPTGASGGQWKFFGSSDAASTYECCYISPNKGSLEEFEIYGWDPFEATTANGVVYFDVPDLTTCAPVLTATFPAGADSVSIEEARSGNGPFAPVATVAGPAGSSLVWTNSSVKVGVMRHYRVASTKDGVTVHGAVRAFTRFRRLERDPADETRRLPKYAYTHTKPFDGLLTDNNDNSGRVGVNFNERVWLAGVRTYPRNGQAGRLDWKLVYAARTDADLNAGVVAAVSSPMRAFAGEFTFTPTVDQENAYQWCYITPDYGNVAEMQIYGWDAADIEAAEEPVFPTRLTAVSGAEEGSADLAWEGAHFIASYKAYYRETGTDAWTLGAEGVGGTTNACTITGLVNGRRYEFRLEGTGEDGYVGVSPTAAALVFRYVPSDGTGLSALLMGDGDLDVLNPGRPRFGRRFFAGVDVNQTESLFSEEPNADCGHALVLMRGQLEAPVSGTYTLRLEGEGADGLALYVDGAACFNKLPCGGFGEAVLELSAGRHSIEIDWISVTEVKRCRLSWACAGVFAGETVPASQLFPAADSGLPLHYCQREFDFTVPSAGNGIPRLTADGDAWILSEGASGDGRHFLPSVSKLMTGSFFAECTVLSGNNPSVIVASPNTPDYQVLLFRNGYTRTRGSRGAGLDNTSGADVPGAPCANAFPGASYGLPYRLRVERLRRPDCDVLAFKTRKDGVTPDGEWVTLWTKTNGVSPGADLGSKTLRVGFTSYSSEVDLKLSDLRFRKLGGFKLSAK